MGNNTNQMATVGNLESLLYYRVNTSDTKYSEATKCVTEDMIQGLAGSPITTAVGRAGHTDVDTSPTYPTSTVTSSVSSGVLASAVDVAKITFTTPSNVGSKTTCHFDTTPYVTINLKSKIFPTTVTGTTPIANVAYDILYPEGYSGSLASGHISIRSNSTAYTTVHLPLSFVCNPLHSNTTYTLNVRVYSPGGTLGVNITASATISNRYTSVAFQCHNKLIKFNSLLNDCPATVPVRLYIGNDKNVATKLDTIKITYNYKTSSTSAITSNTLVTKAWDKVPANGTRTDVVNIPIYSNTIPDAKYNSYATIWGGTAGAKQDVRIGTESGSEVVSFGSYTSCTTKSIVGGSSTGNNPNGFAAYFQSCTGIYFEVK